MNQAPRGVEAMCKNQKAPWGNLQVRKVDPVPALCLSSLQPCGGDRVHLPDLSELRDLSGPLVFDDLDNPPANDYDSSLK